MLWFLFTNHYFNLSFEFENQLWMAKYCLFNVLFPECFCATKTFHHYSQFLHRNKKEGEEQTLMHCHAVMGYVFWSLCTALLVFIIQIPGLYLYDELKLGGAPLLTAIHPGLWSFLLPILLLICVANLQVWSFIASAWNRSRMSVVIFIVWKTKMYLW